MISERWSLFSSKIVVFKWYVSNWSTASLLKEESIKTCIVPPPLCQNFPMISIFSLQDKTFHRQNVCHNKSWFFSSLWKKQKNPFLLWRRDGNFRGATQITAKKPSLFLLTILWTDRIFIRHCWGGKAIFFLSAHTIRRLSFKKIYHRSSINVFFHIFLAFIV